MLDKLKAADFETHADSELIVQFGELRQGAEILSVNRRPRSSDDHRQPFSVTIRSGPTDRYWPQGIYTLVHPRHGELSLFMVPIGPDDKGMCYEINFA